MTEALADLLEPQREVDGDEVEYRFANGLSIRTEVFHKRDRMRILPLGSPQFSLMNHLLAFPEVARGRRTFEPFAGSGALGLMALKVGAAAVDFLDINPRAAGFHRRNAAASGLPASRISSITGDIARFTPEARYDLILANPPFVPTPDGIPGTITSNGGAEGSRFVEILVDRLETLLEPEGRAIVYVFQFERDGEPLVAARLGSALDHRPVDVTPTQEHPISFETYGEAYRRLFPQAGDAIARWQADLAARHGSALTVSHSILEIGPRGEAPTVCTRRDDFAARFGAAFLAPSADAAELAFGRVFENFTANIEAAEADSP